MVRLGAFTAATAVVGVARICPCQFFRLLAIVPESRANRKLPIREAQLPVCRQLVQNLRKGRDRGFFFDPRVLLLPLLAPLNNAFTVRPPSGLQFEPRPDGI